MYKSYIKVRCEFESQHFYEDAGQIDSRIAFLENMHRHLFKVEAKISVGHDDRELEFFLVKWGIQDFIVANPQLFSGRVSCEMMAREILNHLKSKYGDDRYYEIVVSEDGESDGIVEWS